MAKILIDVEQEYQAFIKDYMTMVDSSLVDEKGAVAVVIDSIRQNLGGISYNLLNVAAQSSTRCRDKSILTEALIDLTARLDLKIDELKINNPNQTLRFVDFKEGLLVIEVT